jgi:hypothetical protein
MAKLKDSRDWEKEYKKLKINFDRLDRFNDVLYRFFHAATMRFDDMPNARQAVEDYMNELERSKNG